jgi:hypothetical protein
MNLSKLLTRTGSALVLTAAVHAGAASIPIVNGDFDVTDVTKLPFYNATWKLATLYGPDAASLPGWMVNGSIDITAGYWVGPNGASDTTLDMNGDKMAGSVSQQVTIPFAGTALVHFMFAGNPDRPPDIKELKVSLGADVQSFQVDVTAPPVPTHDNMGWVLKTAQFDVLPGVYTLTFAGANPDASWGAAIDDVSMDLVPRTLSVPEAGATAILLGLGLTGMGLLRRKMSS